MSACASERAVWALGVAVVTHSISDGDGEEEAEVGAAAITIDREHSSYLSEQCAHQESEVATSGLPCESFKVFKINVF